MAGRGKEREPPNFVHQECILKETIKKELREHKMYTDFTINPYKPMYTVTGKPNSFQDAEMDQGQEDELMKTVIARSQRPPTQKYTHPQTSSQEVGWISTPLLKVDRNDIRLNFNKRLTDVTAPKEAEWKLKEQTENMN